MNEALTRQTGEWGEQRAARLLKKKKYRIIGKRVRVGARDEIDLVARDGKVLVFVEVKTRNRTDYGSPASAVDRRKRHALSRAAVRYLKRLRYPPTCFRFDVVEVIGRVGDSDPRMHHIENAFTLDPSYTLPY